MFGFPRLRRLLAEHAQETNMIDWLKAELITFTGSDWVQEDDVTLVMLERLPLSETAKPSPTRLRTLAEFQVQSQPGNERQAMEQVAALVTREITLPPARLERLKTAVAEATMNAMEHGNHFQADLPVEIKVLCNEHQLIIQITDHGGGKLTPSSETPDLVAKLEGRQSPRGWGLFLIKNMVDDLQVSSDEQHHTLELMMNLE